MLPAPRRLCATWGLGDAWPPGFSVSPPQAPAIANTYVSICSASSRQALKGMGKALGTRGKVCCIRFRGI